MLLLLLTGCVNFPYFYDREFYLASLLRWEDNDHDGFREVDGDCDDAEATVNPDIEETCNDRDDNCDEEIDNNALDAQAWFQDNDADGFGNTDVAYVGCDDPTGFSLVDGDCDDTNSNVHPEAEEPCGDAKDVDCDGLTGDHDGDGDGFPACDDCLDTNAAVNRDAVEVCNGGVDDNCDDVADGADALGAVEWFLDADNDNHGAGEPIVQCLAPSNYATVNDDCDDTNPEIWPGTTEICDNGQDDNCDGETNGCRTEGLMITEGRLTALGGSDLGVGLLGPGDLNGDGFADLLIGTWEAEGFPGGAVLLVEGPFSGDRDALAGAVAVFGSTDDGDSWLGAPLRTLGDLNGDGTTEWAIGGGFGGYPSPTYGGLYIMTERAEPADVQDVAVASIWETSGDTAFAYDYAAPGDVDGDGMADVLVGAAADSSGGAYSGAAYLFTSLDGTNSESDAAWRGVGREESSFGSDIVAQDLNGDGMPDLVVGAPGARDESGAIYVFHAPLAASATSDSADAVIDGDQGSLFGLILSEAGDTNSDGVADLWVVAYASDLGAPGAGAAYLFTGLDRSGSAASLNASIVVAESTGSMLGKDQGSISSADMDSNGTSDLVIGAPGYDDGANTDAGKLYLLYGPFPSGITSAATADAWHIGSTEGAGAGGVFTIPGDLDGDGNLDIALQELGEFDGANDRVNILYGYSW